MYNGLRDTTIYSGNIFAGITDHLANYAIIPRKIKINRTSDRPNIRIFSEKKN